MALEDNGFIFYCGDLINYSFFSISTIVSSAGVDSSEVDSYIFFSDVLNYFLNR